MRQTNLELNSVSSSLMSLACKDKYDRINPVVLTAVDAKVMASWDVKLSGL
jgi:hypothetical protein